MSSTYVSPAGLTVTGDSAILVVHVPHGKGRRRIDIPLTQDELLIISANCADAARKINANQRASEEA